MSNADINTAVSNQFLRVIYSIIIPGMIPSLVFIIYFGFLIDDKFYAALSIEKKYVVIFLFVLLVLILGYLMEIFGVWVESRFIDNFLSKQDGFKNFNRVWEKYLEINTASTNGIVIVQYYRTILTKFKFLINLSVAILTGFILFLLLENLASKELLSIKAETKCCFYFLLTAVQFIFIFFLVKRAIYCAKILHSLRLQVLNLLNPKWDTEDSLAQVSQWSRSMTCCQPLLNYTRSIVE